MPSQPLDSTNPAPNGDGVLSSKKTFERYKKLFVHRSDVFSEQQPDGAYYIQRRPLEDIDIEEHLAGFASYGTYVLKTDNTIKYLLFDLDTNDGEAKDWLVSCVESFLFPVGMDRFPCCLLERSGRKGYHIWLFFNTPVSAAKARRWVNRDFMPLWQEKAHRAIYAALDPTRKSGEQVRWPLEVFPKQDEVGADGFGNLVKLPLGVHAVSGKKSEFLSCQGWASGVDSVVPLDASLIPEVPQMMQSRYPARAGMATSALADGAPSPFPCITKIRWEGINEGNRDNAMFHLALFYHGHAVSEEGALNECLAANANFSPPLTEREVRAKVRSAYAGNRGGANCGTGFLRDICPGPCRTGWNVDEKVEVNLVKKAIGDKTARAVPMTGRRRSR